MSPKIAVVVPNWNGEDYLKQCLDSLLNQSLKSTLIVVDNGSIDSSRSILESYGDKIVKLYNQTNLGFAGGVNTGIRYALENNYTSVALFNNDAVADKAWLEQLSSSLKGEVGIVTCSFQSIDKKHIDSTGDQFTTWGLPYPRGRGQKVEENTKAQEEFIFGASGGASLYSCAMLIEIGVFDEDFFAYFEDVDISFRAQLAGWKVVSNPKAIAYHHIGATSKRMKDTEGTVENEPVESPSNTIGAFSTYQSLKNWPLVIIKNVPKELLPIVIPRFFVAYVFFIGSSIFIHRHPFVWIKALAKVAILFPKKLRERKKIQSKKVVSTDYIRGIMTPDLPENQTKLRKLRAYWWRLARQPKNRGVKHG